MTRVGCGLWGVIGVGLGAWDAATGSPLRASVLVVAGLVLVLAATRPARGERGDVEFVPEAARRRRGRGPVPPR